MKILNVSCGAVGAYFTGRLARLPEVEAAVSVRRDVNLIREQGFDIKSIAGDFVFRPAQVITSAEEYTAQADILIYTGKVLPEADTVKILSPYIHPQTVIVLIQNGIGIEDGLQKAFPANEIISAVAYIGVTRTAPGRIEHSGGGKLILGKFGGGDSIQAQKISELFNSAGVSAEHTDNITFYRWRKLLWNVPFNSVSVVGGCLNTAEMINTPKLETLCRELMQEVRLVAQAEGVELSESMVQENIDYTRNFPAYKTSMLIDFEQGRPLEVEAIVGSVCQLAAKHGLSVPRLTMLYALLDAVDTKRQAGKLSV